MFQHIVVLLDGSCVANVSGTLLDIAEQDGPEVCALIVIATRGWHRMDRWVRGNVADRLLRASHLPMLIVHSRKQ